MDMVSYLRFIAALAAVLTLIGGSAWLAKRFGLAGRAVARGKTGRRLSILEVCPLDARRKLVLLRRDNAEHLVLIGGGQDLVIESGIAVCKAANSDEDGRQPVPSMSRLSGTARGAKRALEVITRRGADRT